MAFSKRRPMRRRRRRLPETYTFRQCRACYNVFGATTCSNPLTDAILMLSMATQRNPTLVDTTELTSGADKFIVFDGMKFQDDWTFDNSLVQDCFSPNPAFPNAGQVQTTLTIWEALVVLPFVQGSNTTPAYLPNFTSGSLQQGDVADRVLWKRLTNLKIYGPRAAGQNVIWIDESTDRQGHGPVAVKTRAKLDDRHGLYLVRNFVHDVFWPFSANGDCTTFDCDNCGGDNETRECGLLPVFNNFWAKLFYHARR